MSDLLKEVARHLRQEAGQNSTADYCTVVVTRFDADGNADSLFFGDTEHAEQAMMILPEAAKELAQHILDELGSQQQIDTPGSDRVVH